VRGSGASHAAASTATPAAASAARITSTSR
jgi:hypothetical protein